MLPRRPRARNLRRGFTLIELAIVIAIIGILAAAGIYFYRGMLNKARMTQAKTVLAHLARTEAIFFASNDRYTDNVALLDFDPVRYPFYQVAVVLDKGSRDFTGIATGIGNRQAILRSVHGESRLGSVGGVQGAIRRLIDLDYVEKTDGTLRVVDPVFSMWVRALKTGA